MAQGRFLSSSVAEDERLNGLSIEAQMMYLMAIPHLDRDGLINGNPSVFLGKVCPLRPKLGSRLAMIIDEWTQCGLVVRYATGEGTALWFKGFAKNNPLTHYNREKASRFSPPPGFVRGEKGLMPEDSGALPPEENIPNEASGNPPDISGIYPEASGFSPPEVEVEVEDQASIREPALPAVVYGDDETALVALAYHTIGAFAPSSQTTNGKNAIKVASELLNSYGYERCAREMPTLKERHLAAITDHRRGISAPVSYLQTLLEDNNTGGDLLTGDKLFEANAWQILLNAPLPDYMGQ